MHPYEDKHRPPSALTLAEKRAYMSGYRAARYGVPLALPGEPTNAAHRRWPQAYSRGYWEGHALGLYEGYPIKEG